MNESSEKNRSVQKKLPAWILPTAAAVCSLIVRKALLQTFSIDLIGTSVLLEEWIHIFNVLDAGFTALLAAYLQKSIREKNTEKTGKYLSLFKTVYLISAIVIAAVLILCAPFLYRMFHLGSSSASAVYAYYFLHVLILTVRFLVLDRLTLMKAMQKEGHGILSEAVTEGIVFCLSLYFILVWKSFILYAAAEACAAVLELFRLRQISKKTCPEYAKIPFASVRDIRSSGILKEAGRYSCRTIYDSVYYTTDTILIGILDSSAVVGLLSNYTMILAMIGRGISSLVSSVQASAEKMLQKNPDSRYESYETANMLGFYLSTLMAAVMLLNINDIIRILFSADFVINFRTDLLLIMLLYVNSTMRNSENAFYAAGLKYSEKKPLIVSAAVNIILSIVLYFQAGVFGIHIATLVSTVIYWFGKVYHLQKSVFHSQRKEFLNTLAKNYAFSILTVAVSCWIVMSIHFAVTGFLSLILSLLIIAAVTTAVFALLNFRSRYFKDVCCCLQKHSAE